MELRQLRYFVKMVEIGNMTKAAAELHVAQPSLSQQLASLEASLNIRLLDRGLRGVTPTPAGSLFYKHAIAILRQVADSQLAMRNELGSPSGVVTIAMPSSSARLIAIRLLRHLLEEQPGIQLKLVEVPSANIPALLLRGDVDIAVAPDMLPAESFRVEPLLSEDLFAVLPHGLPHAKKTITLKELAQLPLLLPNRDNGLRSRLDAAFAKRGFAYRLVAEINVTSLLALAVRDGLGVSVLPWASVHEYAQAGEVQVRRIVSPSLKRDLVLCTPHELGPSAAVDVVLDKVRQVCGELAASQLWKGVHAPSAGQP